MRIFDEQDRLDFYRRQAVLLLLFHLLPLLLIIIGIWSVFDVMAFYWMESLAAGVFAIIRIFVSCFFFILERKPVAALQSGILALFFPVHFGFFVIMSCFLVGTFLPEGTETRQLTDPLVPFVMVVQHTDFAKIFPLLLVWEALIFFRESRLAQHFPHEKLSNPVLQAYKKMFILFFSGMVGVFVMTFSGSRFWGALVLTALKTFAALAELFMHYKEDKEGEKGGETP